MTKKICEHGLYGDKRCRKHAVTAVCYKALFGYRLTGKGEIPEYMSRVTLRCRDHENPADMEIMARVGISDYLTALAKAKQ